MQKGFIFNHDMCVNCSACSAACILENGWTIHPRTIYTYNAEAFPSLPLTNLSLACNHCDKPICMEGCPASSIYRESLSGAVIIDEMKCIGCKYCQWNCPYDAPKIDKLKKTIGKCNLCYSLLIDGGLPACANACPTGALSYGDISGLSEEKELPWLPDKTLKPAISVTGKQSRNILRIIPEKISEVPQPESLEKVRNIKGEWSLIAFSYLSVLSVAIILMALIQGKFPDKFLFLSLIFLSGFLSVFHLGKWSRAWRAVLNIENSPVSREIALFILYSVVSIVSILFELPGFILISSIIGLILLAAIDRVYVYADERKSILFHSGQTFLSALLIASFFTGIVLPFVFIAGLKLTSSSTSLYISKMKGIKFGIRFLRMSLLLVAGASLITKISYPDPLIIFLFLTGEFIDRLIFYFDFEPLNIRTLINEHINAARYEKKRS